MGREYFSRAQQQADKIILLEIPLRVRKRRIFFRLVKQLGIEKSSYKPSFAMLKCMLGWANDYERAKAGLHGRIRPFCDKLIILHDRKKTDKFISDVKKL